MSDINYSVTLRVAKGNLDNVVNKAATATMNEVGMLTQTLTLTTNAVSISTVNLSSVGLAYLQNLGTATASTVTVGVLSGGSFVGFCTLKAGEPALLRLTPGATYQATGNAGTRVRIDITEG
jgi:hypothetical protein